MFGYKAIVFSLVLLVVGTDCLAQVEQIQLIQTCGTAAAFEEALITNTDNRPTLDLVNEKINQLLAEDRLEAGIDSIVYDSQTSCDKVYLHVGPRYTFDQISLDSISNDLLDRIDIHQPRTTTEYLDSRAKLADYYATKGYPFARVKLEELQMDNGVISGTLKVDEGNLVIQDSIIINGKVQIRQGYLRNYLDFHKGEPYDHSKVKEIKEKLDKLRFLKTTEDPNLSFIYDYASLNLFVEPRNTSRFDLLFGIIPTNNIQGRQLFLSLDFTTELLNKLGYGEYIFLNFERLRPEQQKLDVRFNYPYLLDSPFAIDLSFEIFRNALDYQTTKSDLGVQYLINSSDYIKVAWNFESSKIVEMDSLAIVNARALPQDLSVTQSGLSVQAVISKLDYRYNPRRGYSIEVGAVGGQRRILIDPGILALSNNEVDFQSLYDSLDLVSPRFELTTSLSYFLPIARRGTVGFLANGGWRYTPGELLRNEKFQIGGNQLLRGFDEASLFTSYYGVASLEYRLLLSENSYFSAPFVDIGYIELNGDDQLAIGIGAGLVAETKVGLFNFSVAVGQNQAQSFDFSRPKAHFGFVSLF